MTLTFKASTRTFAKRRGGLPPTLPPDYPEWRTTHVVPIVPALHPPDLTLCACGRTFATPRNHAQPCRKSLTLRIDWRFMASRGVAALRRSCVVPALPYILVVLPKSPEGHL